MPDEPRSGWPRRLAVAIVRTDSPQVLLASDEDVLSRLVALKRWGDAVAFWREATGEIVDGYPDEDVWSPERLDSDAASFEIRLAPVFVDGPS